MSDPIDVVDALSPEDRAKCDKLKKEFAEYPAHPFADLIPTTGDDDFQSVKESVRAVGVQKDVVLAKIPGGRDWAVLDGRTRIRACVALWEEGEFKAANGEKIEPAFSRLETTNPKEMLDHVKASVARRNLTAGQRAAMAVKVDMQEEALLKEKGEKRTDSSGKKEDFNARWERLHRESGCNHTYLSHCISMGKSKFRDLLDAVASGALKIGEAKKRMDRRNDGLPDVPEPEEVEKDETKGGEKGGDDEPEKKIVLDEDGTEQSGYLAGVFDEAAGFESALRDINAASRKVDTLLAGPSGAFIDEKPFRDAIKEARRILRESRPVRACRMCKGKEKWKGGKCPACDGNRFECKSSVAAAVAANVPFTDAMTPEKEAK